MDKRISLAMKQYTPKDQIKWSLLVTYGFKEPFLSVHHMKDKLYFGQSYILNKNFFWVEILSEGENPIQLSTLKKLADHQKDIDIKEVAKDVQKHIKSMRKKHPEMNQVGYYSHFIGEIGKHGIEALPWSDAWISEQHSFAILPMTWYAYLKLISCIDEVIFKKAHVIIAIDGYSASGKTTLAKKLSSIWHSNLFHIDDFFRKPVIDPLDPQSVYGANIDYHRLENEVILPIQKESAVTYQSMDHHTHTLLPAINMNYRKVNWIEGAFSMHPKIRHIYDFKIFLKVGSWRQKKRIMSRNGIRKFIVFMRRWVPNEKRYFKAFDIEKQADIVIHAKTL